MLFLESPRAVTALGSIAFGGQADPRSQLHSILRQRGVARALSRGRLGVWVRLPANQALRTTIDLPLAAEGNLREVVGFELDRHTPFRADQVYFACRILKRDVIAQRVTIELAVVTRPVIEKAIESADRLGLEPDRIDVAGDAPSAAPSEDLLAFYGGQAARAIAGKLTYGLAAAAFTLAVIALMIPLHATQKRAEALAEEVAGMKKTAEAAALLRKEIDTLREEEAFLVDRRRKVPTVSRLLFDTTRILPDDTWLNEFQLAGAEIQIIGFTASASALTNLLEESRTFRNTTFRSPVTRDLKADRERFHIAARVAREADQ
jgi:general secretion pathway protein L